MKFLDFIYGDFEFVTIEVLEKINETRNTCKTLGVGIFSDELVQEKLGRAPIRPYIERAQIMYAIKGVDFVFEVTDETKIDIKKEEFYYVQKDKKEYKIGYAPGTYDLFHQGHLEHLTEAFSKCEILVVDINNDELVKSYKGKKPLMSAKERAEIVSKLKFVDITFIADTLERKKANEWIKAKYGSGIDAVFIGSDWVGQDLHNDEHLNIVFTDRDPEKMKVRSSTYYREQLKNQMK